MSKEGWVACDICRNYNTSDSIVASYHICIGCLAKCLQILRTQESNASDKFKIFKIYTLPLGYYTYTNTIEEI